MCYRHCHLCLRPAGIGRRRDYSSGSPGVKMRFIGWSALCLWTLTSAASAQIDAAAVERANHEALTRILGTTSVSAQPQFADGKLFGCIVEFGVLAQDWKYKAGGFIRVGGSFGLVTAGGKIAVALKV